MNLNDHQKQTVAVWINEGLRLAEIQKRLESDFSLRLTYMEVRFLIDDLKLVPKDPERPKTPVPTPSPAAPAAPLAPSLGAPAAARVSVDVDKIARPGALVSGKVNFSDGQSAAWYLDETGRLGLVPAVQGYKPTAEDVKAFQLELQQQLQKLGF
jgi:hypothetical protein